MAEPFIGEIRVFPYTFPPYLWAWCDGQVIPISQNQMLYAVIGPTYGGDARVTLGIPNLQRSAPMGSGTGPALSPRHVGYGTGTQSVTLTADTIPEHDHTAYASSEFKPANIQATPTAQSYPGAMRIPAGAVEGYGEPDANAEAMAPQALAQAGMSHPHENRQPFLVMNFCIALEGIFPSRN